jgi:hypothetical protein
MKCISLAGRIGGLFPIVCLFAICQATETIVREASGIVRSGDTLLIVADDADGVYFEVPLDGATGPIIPIDPDRVREVKMPGAELALDLEGIALLADERIVVLSEQLRCLIGRTVPGGDRFSVIAEYDRPFAEFGNRGLEGLAVLREEAGSSRVAVLWEGGYPEREDIPEELRERIERLPLAPVIVVHEVGKGEIVGRVNHPLQILRLSVPEPPGSPPFAQRFRGADLVWHRWSDTGSGGKTVEGFIVLLSSESSPPDTADIPTRYELKVLQRFTPDGKPAGEPLSINELCRRALIASDTSLTGELPGKMAVHMREIAGLLERGGWENINWEGLGWFEEGKSLVAIYDEKPLDPPFAFVFDIPPEWK